ncbi:M23 family metallopeptidase [Streptomyces sp. SID8352]|uniref:peptidoglycan DD-metalloendopeptidase family protein n=1 Tax=Streptomyces sp. SID8352 TaxID=2690338 RepID=UPI00136CC96D|nr:peptidoglycan DD-metalloendopeptidase family protein [Streptomyces sp. SID8352]
MASNRPAPEAPFAPSGHGVDDTFGHGVPRPEEGPWEEWNPTAESVRPVRGRHRVAKQRGGLARSSTVLGVGVIAAVGAGGMASAQTGKPPVSISLPDLPSLPGLSKVGALVAGDEEPSGPETAATPLSAVGVTTADTAQGTADAGEALRTRILEQAEQQQVQVENKAAEKAREAAVKQAAEAARAAADKAAEAKKEAEAKAAAEKARAEEEARKKAEAERLAELARQYTLPTSSYTLTSTFGQAGSMWSSGHHTGLDFAAPTGTLVKAVHTGTVTEAGWAGAYGYRTVLTLEDGTELWYCHQSSISVGVGQQVNTGDVIGRVGATGNVTGPHLHFEVHPGGSASGVDPAAWLRGKGLGL